MNPQNQQYQVPQPNTPPGSTYGPGPYTPSRPGFNPAPSIPAPTPPDEPDDYTKHILSLKALLVVLSVVLFLAVAIVAALLVIRQQQPKKAAPVTSTKPQLCFVRTAHLDCVNTDGANRVRYNLPTPQGNVDLTNLVASADQTKFLAMSSYDATPNDIWALDGGFSILTKLNIPAGMSASTPSWSRDNKTVLLALKDQQNSQQIYRLNPDANTQQQLTTSATPTTTPYEIQDGHILYGVLDSQSGAWVPYVIDKDGSHPHPLGDLTALSSVSGFSYDQANDTVFVYGTAVTGGSAIVYGPINDFLNSKAVQTLAAAVNPGDTIGLVTSKTLFISHNSLASIVDTTNNLPITVRQFGAPIGMLKTTRFHRSDQQEEQAIERIVNLSSAPADFATSAQNIFTQNDKSCQADPTAQADGREFVLVINQVVSDQYAVTSQGCGPLIPTYYAVNSSNTWVQVLTGAGIPTCSLINTYNFPKTIFQQCYSPSGKLVPNDPKTDLH